MRIENSDSETMPLGKLRNMRADARKKSLIL
jgi:hypothetical protein